MAHPSPHLLAIYAGIGAPHRLPADHFQAEIHTSGGYAVDGRRTLTSVFGSVGRDYVRDYRGEDVDPRRTTEKVEPGAIAVLPEVPPTNRNRHSR